MCQADEGKISDVNDDRKERNSCVVTMMLLYFWVSLKGRYRMISS
jgi:hypothetical protein